MNLTHSTKLSIVIGLIFIWGLLFVIALSLGSHSLSFSQVSHIMLAELGDGSEFSDINRTILLHLRLPRVLLAAAAGAVLAGCGVAIQSLVRNPLADPALLGISSGAALGATSFIVVGHLFAALPVNVVTLPLSAFIGSLLITGLLYKGAATASGISVSALLLLGVAFNALIGAVIGLLIVQANDMQLRSVAFWMLGSLSAASWQEVVVTLPLACLVMLGLGKLAVPLNALLLGEAEAYHLGFPVNRIKRWVILLCAAGVGVVTAFAGIIAFIGLIAPHIVRLILGADHRYLMPASLLLGSSLLIVADLIARTLLLPSELPIGIVTALIGAPFFMVLVLYQKNKWAL